MLTTETDFINYCLRKLGEPVTKVNLDPSQVTDAVDDAILKFNQYHRDGYEENFWLYTIPAPPQGATEPSKIIPVPADQNIDDVIEVVRSGTPDFGDRFDTYAWQASAAITSPVTGGWANIQLQDYVALQQRLNELDLILGDEFPMSFSRYRREITLKFRITEGEIYAFRTYRRIDPRVSGNEDAWNNIWLREYATALIKERWGSVLIKASGIKLPGGIELNGSEIYQSAIAEIETLEEQLKMEHQLPVPIVVG